MKTLKTIQTLSKIGKILCKIVCICCVIGICGCAVGAIGILIGMDTLKIGGLTLNSILEAEAGISVGTVWAALAVGTILCIGELIVARMARRYFENELSAGTPFTLDGAKELMHLGISAIWIPIVAVVLAEVAQGVIAQLMENVEKVSMDGFDGVALGVTFIVVSLLCKYGAEPKDDID